MFAWSRSGDPLALQALGGEGGAAAEPAGFLGGAASRGKRGASWQGACRCFIKS